MSGRKCEVITGISIGQSVLLLDAHDRGTDGLDTVYPTVEYPGFKVQYVNHL